MHHHHDQLMVGPSALMGMLDKPFAGNFPFNVLSATGFPNSINQQPVNPLGMNQIN